MSVVGRDAPSTSSGLVAGSRARVAAGDRDLPRETPTSRSSCSSLVCIAASAATFEPLEAFFRQVPAGTSLAFVVVPRADPSPTPFPAQRLSNSTPLVIEFAHDGQRLDAEHVYVAPPHRWLTIEDGLLRVREFDQPSHAFGVVDHCLRSLAADQRERAIAVILSGVGTEGALGARAVKAAGGLVLAQSPETAPEPGMPSSVIAAGIVDLVVAPEAMAHALVGYVEQVQRRQPLALRSQWAALVEAIRLQSNYDLRGYQPLRLHWPVARRMMLWRTDSVAEYVEILRMSPAESDRLLRDMLIGRTTFFRDPDTMKELADTVLPALMTDSQPDSAIRAWVPGCSSGEDAYTLAIVIAEKIAASLSARTLRIFATDVDLHALGLARAGVYPEAITLDVAPERLRSCFSRGRYHYRIAEAIRDTVTCARHNLIQDFPFAKMDVISCHHLIDWFEPDVQANLFSLFHFSLKPGGCLILGASEAVPTAALFEPVSPRRRIFRRLESPERRFLRFPTPAAVSRDLTEERGAEPRGDTLESQSEQLFHVLSQAVDEAPSFEVAVKSALEAIGRSERWQLGYVYAFDREQPGVLVPLTGFVGRERLRPFHLLSLSQRYTAGELLPGRVCQDRAAIWVNDAEQLVELLPNRGVAAHEAGLQSVAAFPICCGAQVVGVLELFSDQRREMNQRLDDLLTHLCAQMAQWLKRRARETHETQAGGNAS